MVILNKYNSTLYLNYKNLYFLSNIKNKKAKKEVNYIFMYKNKFLREFIYFYSIFLTSNQLSFFNQKNNPSFKISINYKFILFLEEDYNNFQ